MASAIWATCGGVGGMRVGGGATVRVGRMSGVGVEGAGVPVAVAGIVGLAGIAGGVVAGGGVAVDAAGGGYAGVVAVAGAGYPDWAAMSGGAPVRTSHASTAPSAVSVAVIKNDSFDG